MNKDAENEITLEKNKRALNWVWYKSYNMVDKDGQLSEIVYWETIAETVR